MYYCLVAGECPDGQILDNGTNAMSSCYNGADGFCDDETQEWGWYLMCL